MSISPRHTLSVSSAVKQSDGQYLINSPRDAATVSGVYPVWGATVLVYTRGDGDTTADTLVMEGPPLHQPLHLAVGRGNYHCWHAVTSPAAAPGHRHQPGGGVPLPRPPAGAQETPPQAGAGAGAGAAPVAGEAARRLQPELRGRPPGHRGRVRARDARQQQTRARLQVPRSHAAARQTRYSTAAVYSTLSLTLSSGVQQTAVSRGLGGGQLGAV